MKLQCVIITIFIVLNMFVSTTVFAGNIDPGKNLVWGENTGWVNLAPDGKEGVTVSNDTVSGSAWSENIGWINLSPENISALRGVKNNGEGNLSGYAWSENSGWIKFDEVYIDPCTGIFGGKAWGENTGWINFDVSDTSKNVVTAWRKDTDDDGTPDCNDQCPNDALKTEPGTCDCGVADTDADADGIPDCNETAIAPEKSSSGSGGSCFILSVVEK